MITAISDDVGLTKTAAGLVLDSFIKHVSQTLASGGDVTLSGFGTFSVSERSARVGRNPRTGESVDIAAAKSPKFKPAKALKDAVN
jgi:DNA-binding protein HU-beta